MAPRSDLQSLLEEITDNVYFQPPTNLIMKYPCIIYEINGSKSVHADNKVHVHTWRYQVTVVDQNPDTDLSNKVVELPQCEFNRSYQADNLNHYVFTLFF